MGTGIFGPPNWTHHIVVPTATMCVRRAGRYYLFYYIPSEIYVYTGELLPSLHTYTIIYYIRLCTRLCVCLYYVHNIIMCARVIGRCVNRLYCTYIMYTFDWRCCSGVVSNSASYHLTDRSGGPPKALPYEPNFRNAARVSRLQRVSARKVRFPRRARANRATHITQYYNTIIIGTKYILLILLSLSRACMYV